MPEHGRREPQKGAGQGGGGGGGGGRPQHISIYRALSTHMGQISQSLPYLSPFNPRFSDPAVSTHRLALPRRDIDAPRPVCVEYICVRCVPA